MALNSRADRFSLLNFLQPWNTTLPDPSGSVTEEDRIIYLNGYTGFVSEEPIPDDPIDNRTDRFSMLNMFQPWNVTPPVPSGSINTTDRIAYLSSYTGFFEDVPIGTIEGLLHINIAWATT